MHRILLTTPTKNARYTRIEIILSGEKYQASMFTKTQVFHKNFDLCEVDSFVESFFGAEFLQYTAWDGKREHSARYTKKGKVLRSSKVSETKPPELMAGTFNKQKSHIIKEGEHIPVLVDMGVFSKNYKVLMHDKFRQINRFIELIDDETKGINRPINIIDFGCGKSYLTFLVYHYFTQVRKLSVNICGLDLNEHVIETCTTAVQKYGYKSLFFKLGDIGNQTAPPLEQWGTADSFNIVISLHACDTATDHALYNAIRWEADLICAVPCCQHELRKQMKPRKLGIFSDYGIIEERIAALATDAIRAKLLEHAGYRTQIIEFTAMEHTAKNLMIRARRTVRGNPLALETVRELMDEFSFRPALVELLEKHCKPL